MKAIENLLRPFAGMLPGRSVLAIGSELGTIETFLTANGARFAVGAPVSATVARPMKATAPSTIQTR